VDAHGPGLDAITAGSWDTTPWTVRRPPSATTARRCAPAVPDGSRWWWSRRWWWPGQAPSVLSPQAGHQNKECPKPRTCYQFRNGKCERVDSGPFTSLLFSLWTVCHHKVIHSKYLTLPEIRSLLPALEGKFSGEVFTLEVYIPSGKLSCDRTGKDRWCNPPSLITEHMAWLLGLSFWPLGGIGYSVTSFFARNFFY